VGFGAFSVFLSSAVPAGALSLTNPPPRVVCVANGSDARPIHTRAERMRWAPPGRRDSRGETGPEGPFGATEATGPAGPAGPQGPPGLPGPA